ncbi:lipopolysaccharide biosynthesis protein [Pedobacter sp. P351]|uniref:lipopolysaccharide biosynthesis protein n=1 Tax=Pedobacter superstes TaxID=3133441 RepID=UPI0030B07F66
MSLREKTISGILWSFTEQFSAKLLSFCITIVLARILDPAEFGIIAMFAVFISIGNSLMDSGLTSSLIRTNDANQRDYSTIFFFNLIGSVFLYFILFLLAPYLSLFYKQEILTNIIRVYGLTLILNAFFTIQNTRLSKEMDFKAQTIIIIPSVLGGGLLGIILAKMGYGVWSLVWMSLLNSLLSTLMHWTYSGWRPDWVFDKESFKKHFFFGYKMTLSGLLDTIYQNIYIIIIGKFYSATLLGYYSRANSISQLSISNISAALNKVTYPMFASISNDDKKLKGIYKKILQQVLFWNAPALIFLGVIAEPLFRFLLTEKWLPAVPYFQILCFAGIMYPLHAYNLNILKVKGRSDLFLKLEVVKKIISVIGIVIAIPFGIYGLLYFQLIFSVLGYFINSFYSGKIIGYTFKEQLADIFPVIFLSCIIGALCYFLDRYLFLRFQLPDFTRLIIAGVFYFLMYLSSSNIIKLNAIIDFKQLILKK